MDIPTVVIAEKNSVANEISKVFPQYIVSSVAGHIKKLIFKNHSSSPWLKTKLLNILQDQMIYVDSELAQKSLSNIKGLKKLGSIDLILAMDPDQQGDLIAQHVLKEFDPKKLNSVRKIKLESLSKKGIQQAFENISPLDGTEGYSADLRTRLDLLFGAILSRYVSLDTFKQSKKWITFNSGRVQTPTLKFVKDKTQEILSFKPEDYFMIKLTDNPYIGEVQLPQKYKEPLVNSTTLEITHLGQEEQKIEPKPGLNTDELLTLLSREHAVFKKITTSTTNLLSTMYLEGKITYPRTDNNSYENYKDLLVDTSKLYEKEFNCKAILPPLNSSKNTTDHSPISPLVSISEVSSPLEKKVLETLYNHLKKVFSGPNIYIRHYFITTINTQPIKFSLLHPIKKSFEDGLVSTKVDAHPKFNVKCELLKKTTKPPNPYTSSMLLKQMKKHGVGTKSTRTTILENLVKNEYLIYKDCTLKITPKGNYLCNYWSSKWSQIISSSLTKDIEELFPLKKEENIHLEYKKYQLKLSNLITTNPV